MSTLPVVDLEVEFTQKLVDLHQLLYTRGGIRPVNAAIEELSKLLLLEIAAERYPTLMVSPFGSLTEILAPECVTIESAKAAFRAVIQYPDMSGKAPNGQRQPVWPSDEPLRIDRQDVLAQALGLLHEYRSNGAVLDPLGTAFDAFLQGKYDHAGGLGTYLTPSTVTRAMARIGFALLEPVGWDRTPLVADPCCGTGRFLVAALEEVRSHVGTALDEDEYRTFLTNGLFGADIASSSVAKARVNLLSYGIHEPSIFTVEDSITDPSLDSLRGKVNLILTNPPFGDGKYDSEEGIERTSRLFPDVRERSRIDPALAFIARCMDLLADDGVLGIVLPDGILDGRPFKSAYLQGSELFGSQGQVEAVISLPTVTFALSGTVAKTSAVFLRKGAKTNRVIHAGCADHVGYLKQAGTSVVDPEGDDLPVIAEIISTSISDHKFDGFQLQRRRPLVVALPRADASSASVAHLDAESIEARAALNTAGAVELGTVLKPVVRRRGRNSAAQGLPFVSVLHVNDLGVVSWREAREYAPTTPGLTARAGDILISLLNPKKLRATVVPEEFPLVQCSAEFGVFEAQEDPYAVLALIQHPLVRVQMAPLGRGTSSSRRRIEPDDVLHLLVPRHDRSWFTAAATKVREALALSLQVEQDLLDVYFG